MTRARIAPLALLALLALPATAGDGLLRVDRAKIRLRPNAERDHVERFAVRGALPPGAELTALDVPREEIEVRIGDRTVMAFSENVLGKLWKERRDGVWRARSGPFTIRLDTRTGEVRVRTRRADLSHLDGRTGEGTPVSIRFGALACTTVVDFEVRGNRWRFRAPRD